MQNYFSWWFLIVQSDQRLFTFIPCDAVLRSAVLCSRRWFLAFLAFPAWKTLTFKLFRGGTGFSLDRPPPVSYKRWTDGDGSWQLRSVNDGPYRRVEVQVDVSARVPPNTSALRWAQHLTAEIRRLRHVHDVTAKCVVQVTLNRFTGFLTHINMDIIYCVCVWNKKHFLLLKKDSVSVVLVYEHP